MHRLCIAYLSQQPSETLQDNAAMILSSLSRHPFYFLARASHPGESCRRPAPSRAIPCPTIFPMSYQQETIPAKMGNPSKEEKSTKTYSTACMGESASKKT